MDMDIKQRYLLLCMLFVITALNAQDDHSKKISFNGYVLLDHFSFFEQKKEKVNSRNQGILQLDVSSNLGKNYSLFSSVEFRNDLSDASRNRVYVEEAYIDLFFNKWDLRVGKQIISWGKADGFNPVNTLNAIDYSDILDTGDENIGIFGLNGKWYIGDWELQAVYSPIFTHSVLPSNNSRWQFEMPTTVQIQNKTYQTAYSIYAIKLEDKFKNGQFAVKLSGNFKRLDMSLVYFTGYNDIPEIIQLINEVNDDEQAVLIDIQQKYYRHQGVSSDFSLALGKYIFKGEGALHFPEDIPNNKPYFQYVVGVDRTFNNVIGDNGLFVIFQWMHEIKNKNIEYSGRDFNHLFQKNLMCRIEMDFSGTTKISLRGVYALKYQDFYIKPEFSYNIADGLNFILSADILGGNKKRNGLFSGYSDNSRFQAKLKYNF